MRRSGWLEQVGSWNHGGGLQQLAHIIFSHFDSAAGASLSSYQAATLELD